MAFERLWDWLSRWRGGAERVAMHPCTEAELRQLERSVERELEAGNTGLAARKLRKALRRHPRDPEVALFAADTYYDAGAWAEAARAFELAERLQPDEAYPVAMHAAARIQHGDLAGAPELLKEALRRDPRSPDALYWQAVLLDFSGQGKRALRLYRQAEAGAPDDYRVPCRVSRKRFLQMAEHALAALGRELEGFSEALRQRNVDLRIQDVPSVEQIEHDGIGPLWLGVFQGYSAADFSLEDPWSNMPGHVILFQRNLERECAHEGELYEQIRITLLHEVAHAHGREEDWMEERGLS